MNREKLNKPIDFVFTQKFQFKKAFRPNRSLIIGSRHVDTFHPHPTVISLFCNFDNEIKVIETNV